MRYWCQAPCPTTHCDEHAAGWLRMADLHGCLRALEDVKKMRQLGDFHEVIDLFGYTDQLHTPPLFTHRAETGNQRPKARAVDKRDALEIQDKITTTLSQAIVDDGP